MDILAINLLSGLLSVKNITREVQLELVCLGNLVYIFIIKMGLRGFKKSILLSFGQLESTSKVFRLE